MPIRHRLLQQTHRGRSQGLHTFELLQSQGQKRKQHPIISLCYQPKDNTDDKENEVNMNCITAESNATKVEELLKATDELMAAKHTK